MPPHPERARPPQRLDNVDVATLPLSPIDAFVLSQLDGFTDLEEIAMVTGLDDATLRDTLRRLERLGAVSLGGLGGATAQSRPDPRREVDEPVIEQREEHVSTSRTTLRSARLAEPPPPPPAPTSEPAAEAVSDVDLDADQRRRIDGMFARLAAASHYALLGVERDADKKTIKNAYYALIPVFHPDKYFGKRLGGFKKKLERIFERLTEAETVLTRKASRAEYDTYLESRRETHALDAVMTSVPPPPPPSQRPAAAAAVAPAPDPTPVPAVESLPVDPVEAAEQRSRALVRRLANRHPAARSPEVSEPRISAVSGVTRERASDSLKRFLTTRRSPRVETFVKAGEDAIATESWVSAVNALRIALNLAPDDDGVRALYDRADAEAKRHLSKSHEASARYEEKRGHWEEAANSWQRVAAGRPDDAMPLQRAAECYLHTSDPRQGLKAAREAVMLAPEEVEYRLTLVRAYEASELIASAIGELGRAIAKRPDDPELHAWRRRLQKA